MRAGTIAAKRQHHSEKVTTRIGFTDYEERMTNFRFHCTDCGYGITQSHVWYYDERGKKATSPHFKRPEM